MHDVKRTALFLVATAVGCLLYLGLNWIPVIGPIAAGMAAGRIMRGNHKDGFNAGVASGSAGFLLLLFLLSRWGLLDTGGSRAIFSILILWILVVYNFVGIMLAGIGGAAGSLWGYMEEFMSAGPVIKKPNSRRFVICPNCGVGNLEEKKFCNSCGAQLAT